MRGPLIILRKGFLLNSSTFVKLPCVLQVATGGRRVEAAEGLLGPRILWISRSHSEDVEKGSIVVVPDSSTRAIWTIKRVLLSDMTLRLRLYEIDTYQLVSPVIRGLNGSGVQLLQK